jgi:hypothetical protein
VQNHFAKLRADLVDWSVLTLLGRYPSEVNRPYPPRHDRLLTNDFRRFAEMPKPGEELCSPSQILLPTPLFFMICKNSS